jgi:O-methyltransferase involved in polyketide biosynthesis
VTEDQSATPDSTAVRVALWRAMHVQVDPPPHVLEDEVGLQLAAPDDDWRQRPDMDPVFTSGFRAAVVAQARFIEDLVAAEAEAAADGRVGQYVLLGAGLDTFAPSAARTSPLAYASSRSIGPVLKPGNASA